MQKFLKGNYVQIVFLIIFLITTPILAYKGKPDYMLAFSGIVIGMFAPYFTKSVELEKQGKQLIFNEKIQQLKELDMLLAKWYIKTLELSFFVNGADEENKKITIKSIDLIYEEILKYRLFIPEDFNEKLLKLLENTNNIKDSTKEEIDTNSAKAYQNVKELRNILKQFVEELD